MLPLEPGTSAIAAAVRWCLDLLTGRAATLVAVIAVAAVGFALLQGRIDTRHAARVVLGSFILLLRLCSTCLRCRLRTKQTLRPKRQHRFCRLPHLRPPMIHTRELRFRSGEALGGGSKKLAAFLYDAADHPLSFPAF